mgnify:CR=1 FL=1
MGNFAGSRRLSAGAARDHLLGFAGVNGRGEAIVSWDVEMTVADAITTGWLIRDRLSWPHDEADYDAVSTFLRALLIALHGWVAPAHAMATA